MTFQKSLLHLFFLLTSSLCVDPLVELSYSTYEGTPLSNGISQWLGIRYAAPPLGNLRFEAPKDPVVTEGVQTADAVSLGLVAGVWQTVTVLAWPDMSANAWHYQPSRQHSIGGLPIP